MHKILLSSEWTDKENQKYEELLRSGARMKDIAICLSRSERSCWHRIEKLKLNGIYHARKYYVNDNFWSVPNKLNSYWAGFSAADCYIGASGKNSYRYNLELSIKDKNHIEQFIKDANFTGTYKEFKITKKIQSHQEPSFIHTTRLRITSRRWGLDLKNNFNIVSKKTNIISVPNLSKELQECFLVGYIDGDGCIVLDKNERFSIGFVSSSKTIMDWIIQYIKDNFIKNTLSLGKPINYRKKRGNSYEFSVNGVRAAVLFDYLSQIEDIPKLSRKWMRPEVLEYVNSLKIKYPHLFKTFEYNESLNKQMQYLNTQQLTSSNLPIQDINLTNSLENSIIS